VPTISERGDLFFFYRPRVGRDEAHDLRDVQRVFLILKPDGRRRYRRLIVGAKHLPDPARHERVWAFVAEVTARPSELRDDVERTEYVTRTRGARVQPPARPAGEARYAIAQHERHTHLSYALELPPEPGPAQSALGIEGEASYIAAVRNPEVPTPPGAGLPPRRRAEFPPELQERFGGRRFTALDPPEFLDHPGAELVLIGATADAEAELGIDIDAERERVEAAGIFRELRLRPGEIPVDPLVKGRLR
jgi:hypothetical protein